MKLSNDNKKIVCDIKGCNNIAKYKLVLDVGSNDCLRLCEDCLVNFYNEATKKIGEDNCYGRKTKKGK